MPRQAMAHKDFQNNIIFFLCNKNLLILHCESNDATYTYYIIQIESWN